MSKCNGNRATIPTQAPPPASSTLETLRITWRREDLHGFKASDTDGALRAAGEITGAQLARILGTLDRLRRGGGWEDMLDEHRTRALLLGVQEILATVAGGYSELDGGALGLIVTAVDQANAILHPIPLPGPEAFTVHLGPAPAAAEG